MIITALVTYLTEDTGFHYYYFYIFLSDLIPCFFYCYEMLCHWSFEQNFYHLFVREKSSCSSFQINPLNPPVHTSFLKISELKTIVRSQGSCKLMWTGLATAPLTLRWWDANANCGAGMLLFIFIFLNNICHQFDFCPFVFQFSN